MGFVIFIGIVAFVALLLIQPAVRLRGERARDTVEARAREAVLRKLDAMARDKEGGGAGPHRRPPDDPV